MTALEYPSPRADRPAPPHNNRGADITGVFSSVLCAVDPSGNGQAAWRHALRLAAPGGTVATVPSSSLTRYGRDGLPEGWTDHDLLGVGAGSAGLAAIEYSPIPLLVARPTPPGVAVTDSILVVVDRSPESDAAVELADRLAAAHSGTITILVAPGSDVVLERAIARSRRRLLHATGAVPRVVGEPRPPERAIPAAAAALQASMILLPAGPTRRDRRTAARVAGAVECSVLLVPGGGRLL